MDVAIRTPEGHRRGNSRLKASYRNRQAVIQVPHSAARLIDHHVSKAGRKQARRVLVKAHQNPESPVDVMQQTKLGDYEKLRVTAATVLFRKEESVPPEEYWEHVNMTLKEKLSPCVSFKAAQNKHFYFDEAGKMMSMRERLISEEEFHITTRAEQVSMKDTSFFEKKPISIERIKSSQKWRVRDPDHGWAFFASLEGGNINIFGNDKHAFIVGYGVLPVNFNKSKLTAGRVNLQFGTPAPGPSKLQNVSDTSDLKSYVSGEVEKGLKHSHIRTIIISSSDSNNWNLLMSLLFTAGTFGREPKEDYEVDAIILSGNPSAFVKREIIEFLTLCQKHYKSKIFFTCMAADVSSQFTDAQMASNFLGKLDFSQPQTISDEFDDFFLGRLMLGSDGIYRDDFGIERNPQYFKYLRSDSIKIYFPNLNLFWFRVYNQLQFIQNDTNAASLITCVKIHETKIIMPEDTPIDVQGFAAAIDSSGFHISLAAHNSSLYEFCVGVLNKYGVQVALLPHSVNLQNPSALLLYLLERKCMTLKTFQSPHSVDFFHGDTLLPSTCKEAIFVLNKPVRMRFFEGLCDIKSSCY